MLTHVNPSVAVCEEKSKQILPQRVPGDPFQAKFGGIPRFGPLWQVLRGFDTLQGITLNFFALCGGPFGTCARTLGQVTSAIGGTVYVEAHMRERGQCTHKEALQALQGPHMAPCQKGGGRGVCSTFWGSPQTMNFRLNFFPKPVQLISPEKNVIFA